MNEQGYTLLEVTLFLAISGLLALVAFIGLGPRLRNVRFTEAVRSLESSIQRNLAESNLGSRQSSSQITCRNNPDGGVGLSILRNQPGGREPGATAHCVLNGRVAIIRADSITYREIVSRRMSSSCSRTEPFEVVTVCHDATVLNNAAQSPLVYQYSNGVQIVDGLPNTGVQGYGYIIHPQDGSRIIFSYQHSGNGTGRLANAAFTEDFAAANAIDMCFGLSSRRAQITFSNQTLTPIVNFEGC